MARISFRQGIVSHQTDSLNNPVFLDLTNGYVDLVVSPDPTIIAFVHDDADYLYTESVSVSQAWGPIQSGVTTWIYWDLSLVDGSLTRGQTLLEPIESNNQPTSPNPGQMWFRPSKRQWYEWNGTRFVEVIRVFAARIVGGTIFQSMSIAAPKFTGTQVGLTNRRRVGALVYGKNGKPLRNAGSNKFFTTEDDFVTGVPTAASLRINNTILTGKTICPLAAYQVVEYNDFDSICAANPAQHGKRLFGIIEEDAATGEVINFITEGIVFNENWDWIGDGASANDPLYIDGTGQLVRSNPFQQTLPVGLIIGRQEIFFAPRMFVEVVINNNGGTNTGTGLTPAQLAQLNQAFTVSGANQSQISDILANTIPDLEADIAAAQTAASDAVNTANTALSGLSSRVQRAGDTMLGALLGQLTQDNDPANTFTTKSYVDKYARGYQTNFASSIWVGTAPRIFVIPQSVHGLPLNTLYHVTVKDDATGKVVTVDQEVNEQTGLVTIKTNGAAFAGVIRIS